MVKDKLLFNKRVYLTILLLCAPQLFKVVGNSVTVRLTDLIIHFSKCWTTFSVISFIYLYIILILISLQLTFQTDIFSTDIFLLEVLNFPCCHPMSQFMA